MPRKPAEELLRSANLKKSARNAWPEKTIQELRKTANTFAQAPWSLLKAEAWLEKLCDENQRQVLAEPVPLTWIWQPDKTLLPLMGLEDRVKEPEEPVADAPKPREIHVVKGKKRRAEGADAPARGMKRPAAKVLRRPAAVESSSQPPGRGIPRIFPASSNFEFVEALPQHQNQPLQQLNQLLQLLNLRPPGPKRGTGSRPCCGGQLPRKRHRLPTTITGALNVRSSPMVVRGVSRLHQRNIQATRGSEIQW